MSPERAAFERAVAEYELVGLALPEDAIAVAGASLQRTGLFLLGEAHGVAQTPSAIFGLALRLGARSLAFEWAYDELDDVVQPVLRTGRIDSDALWSLPPTAEVFSGDGRFTVGHVRLLERLSELLDRIVLLDRAGAHGTERERAMATRLLAERERTSPMVAILGASHVVRTRLDEVEPVGLLVDREVSGVANGILAPSSGTVWFHGVRNLPPEEVPPVDVVVPLGVARPATVPRRPIPQS
jgi:hypothetical protein